MTRVSDWIVVDGYCAARIIEGGDINKIADRVAFIEKTPRVRIRRYGTPFSDPREARDKDFLNWCEGHDWKADGCSGDQDASKLGAYGFSAQARAWCDHMLVMLGYELPGVPLMKRWQDAYAAFKGRFDTPVERRHMSDEFAQDARQRLRDFDEAMRALDPKGGRAMWYGSEPAGWADQGAQQARKCLYCNIPMIAGSECTSASQSSECDMRKDCALRNL